MPAKFRRIPFDFVLHIMYGAYMTKKKQAGRPPKPKSEKQGSRVSVNMTASERKTIEAAAKAQSLTVSALLIKPWRKES